MFAILTKCPAIKCSLFFAVQKHINACHINKYKNTQTSKSNIHAITRNGLVRWDVHAASNNRNNRNNNRNNNPCIKSVKH